MWEMLLFQASRLRPGKAFILMVDGRHSQAIAMLALAAAFVSASSGCGSSHPMAQVSGRVVFKNGPMPSAGVRYIRFECTADTDAAVRKGASGIINDDGSFELFTRRPGDGVNYGTYAVTFAIFPGVMDHRSLVPIEYTSAAATPYKRIVVDKDLDNLKFEIDQSRAPNVPVRNR
jgi:hypothetical protein